MRSHSGTRERTGSLPPKCRDLLNVALRSETPRNREKLICFLWSGASWQRSEQIKSLQYILRRVIQTPAHSWLHLCPWLSSGLTVSTTTDPTPGPCPGRGAQQPAARQPSHLYVLLDFITPFAPKSPQPGFSGLGKNAELNMWQMCSGSRGFHSFADLQFLWQSNSVQASLIISYPITLWGLEVCEFSFEHMTKSSQPDSVRDPRASLQKR